MNVAIRLSVWLLLGQLPTPTVSEATPRPSAGPQLSSSSRRSSYSRRQPPQISTHGVERSTRQLLRWVGERLSVLEAVDSQRAGQWENALQTLELRVSSMEHQLTRQMTRLETKLDLRMERLEEILTGMSAKHERNSDQIQTLVDNSDSAIEEHISHQMSTLQENLQDSLNSMEDSTLSLSTDISILQTNVTEYLHKIYVELHFEQEATGEHGTVSDEEISVDTGQVELAVNDLQNAVHHRLDYQDNSMNQLTSFLRNEFDDLHDTLQSLERITQTRLTTLPSTSRDDSGTVNVHNRMLQVLEKVSNLLERRCLYTPDYDSADGIEQADLDQLETLINDGLLKLQIQIGQLSVELEEVRVPRGQHESQLGRQLGATFDGISRQLHRITEQLPGASHNSNSSSNNSNGGRTAN